MHKYSSSLSLVAHSLIHMLIQVISAYLHNARTTGLVGRVRSGGVRGRFIRRESGQVELTCPDRKVPFSVFERLSKDRFKIRNPDVSSDVASIGSSISRRSDTFHLVSSSSSNIKWNSCILRLQTQKENHILIHFSASSSASVLDSDEDIVRYSDEITRSSFMKYIHNLVPENETTTRVPIPTKLKNDENAITRIEESMDLSHRLKTKFILGDSWVC